MTASDYMPRPEHKFSFGLWTVGNRGRDPFGDAVRPTLRPVDAVRLLAEAGAWGVNLHDNDLIPFGADLSQRNRTVRAAQKVMGETGIVCAMATTNLFSLPVFKDGAFTSSDAKIRAFAIRPTSRTR